MKIKCLFLFFIILSVIGLFSCNPEARFYDMVFNSYNDDSSSLKYEQNGDVKKVRANSLFRLAEKPECSEISYDSKQYVFIGWTQNAPLTTDIP